MFESIFIFGLFDYIAILLIIFLGVPHGAFDASVGMTLGLLDNKKSKFIFLTLYIIIALIVVFIWYLFPKFSLIIFLYASVFHFGLGDIKWSNNFKYVLGGYFNGGLIIFGISFLKYSEVNYIYQILVDDNDTELIWSFLRFGGYIWFIIVPFHFYFNHKDHDKIYLARIFILGCMIYLTPPIVSFTIYFCFIHSLHHVYRILPSLKKNLKKRIIRNLFLIFTFLSWILGFLLFFFLMNYNSLDNSLIKLTFIGLAALTFPHMILIDIIYRPKTKI